MKLKLTIPLMILFLGLSLQIIGQRTIKGTVTSTEGEPLIGASVVVKGTNNGTITDLDGKFELKARKGDILEISYIGFNNKDITVGDQDVINIQLEQGVKLDEVVVTALGIKKTKKSLVSAVSNLKKEVLLEGNQQNLPNAIKGKVPGVVVTNSGGAPGASSVILIRGSNSLSGNNQPLFVVDGIPIDNSTEYGESVATSNRAIDINSEDIESVSILKGASAAALYGIKAANGVVIITTKSGKAGRGIMTYSGTVSFDNVVGTPEIQTRYGQGSMLSSGEITKETTFSWNDTALDASVKTYNNIADFYQRALTHNHNLTYSGGNDKSTYYFSAGFLDQDGVINHAGYKRTTLKVKANSKFKKNLIVTGSMNYVNSRADRTRQGSSKSGSFRSLLNYPIDIDMKDYLNEDGTQKHIPGLTDFPIDNPYWSAINNPVTNRVDRYISIGNIIYSPFSFMDIKYTLGTDMFFEKNKSVYSYGSAAFNEGYIGEYGQFKQITTSTAMLDFHKKFNDYNFGLILGNNVEDNYRKATYWSGKDFIEPDFVSINNVEQANRKVSQRIRRYRIIGNFADFKVDWKSLIFLNFTGRYDISSTLPKSNNGFFYPSIGLSVIASDVFNELGIDISDDILSYWKLRTSYAQVGKDAPPHVLATPMMSSTNSYTVDPQGFFRNVYPSGNPGIKPEFTNSFEIGTDLRLFQGKVSVDFSYFNNVSDDQILFIRMPPTAGTFGGYLNDGAIRNKGIELLLGLKPVKTKDIKWDLSLNFAKIQSTVESLPGNIPQVEESDSWAFNGIAEGAAFLNGPVSGIFGREYAKDSLGNLILKADGYPRIADQLTYLGKRDPDWTLGITNTIDYKDFTLSFLWDISYGNKVVNATKAAMAYYGLSPETLDRYTEYTFKGLLPVKEGGETVYKENDKAVILDQDYYQKKYSAVAEPFVEDGSWLRLRYISLTYHLPLKDNMKGKIFLTARNMLIFTKYTGIDPEVNSIGASVKGTGSVGIDNLGTPSTKGVDLGFKFSF